MFHPQQFYYNAVISGDLSHYLEIFNEPVQPVEEQRPVPIHQGLIAQNQIAQNQDSSHIFQTGYELLEAPNFIHEEVVVESQGPVYHEIIAEKQVQDSNDVFQNSHGSVEILESGPMNFFIPLEDLSKYMEILQEPEIQTVHIHQESVVQNLIQDSKAPGFVHEEIVISENQEMEPVIAQNQIKYHGMMRNQQYHLDDYRGMDQGLRPGSSGPVGEYPVNYGIQEPQKQPPLDLNRAANSSQCFQDYQQPLAPSEPDFASQTIEKKRARSFTLNSESLKLPLTDGEKILVQNLAKRISYEIQLKNVSQKLFSQQVLGRPPNYLSKMLNHPGDWESQTTWKDKWRQMLSWLSLCEADKSAVLTGAPLVCCEFQAPSEPKYNPTRISYTKEQKKQLLEYFEKNANPTHKECEEIADRMGLQSKQVRIYFKNLRIRIRS